jgi:hypothetical protein
MTEPPGEPPEEPGAAALAEQIARLRETLGEFQRVLGEQRGQLAAQDERMDRQDERMDRAQVDELAARFAKLAQVVADALDAAAPKGPALPRWDKLEGTARDLELGRVRKWVARVLRPLYLDGGRPGWVLPECWHQHPHAVMELSWLSIYWAYIWDRPRPGPIREAADWHDRWLPDVMGRLEYLAERCRYEHTRTADTPGSANRIGN